ncbi:gamma-glutamylcyclotransferase family protein [Elongatibacter sediminis]|uniref:Gamma-glutamylcyclotransferase family protein n=1 Tax=Elongatibacter sediminis TaxID=3119006 RepID=A0AAW9R8X5_9GAMM
MHLQTEKTSVFFYGLFMDEAVLASRGIRPSSAVVGYLENYGLRIGERATLVPDEGNRAYGVLMQVPADDLADLYSQDSVADYAPESIFVTLPDGRREPAVCYNLPASRLTGTNARYATDLMVLANRLGLPESYLRQIEKYLR